MEILLVLLAIIIVILLISINNKTSQQRDFIFSIEQKIRELSQQIKNISAVQTEKEKPKEKEEFSSGKQTSDQSIIGEAKKVIEELKKEDVIPEPVNLQKKIPEITSNAPIPDIPPPPTPPTGTLEKKGEKIFEPEQGWWQTWMQNNPDLEKFIGENLANKIGIGVLVLGISFFVKYAIDKDWINEVGRVIIGLLSGGLLIGLAHRTRGNYRSFSSVLVGGGLTVFYFTIAYAFHQYHLMAQQAAFGIMVLITAFAVGLSLLYDRMELAVLATLGGFITPFLVTTGQDNYISLFTYLCILNTGLMVLAWFKKWTPINFIALFFTILIYGGWLSKRLLSDEINFPIWNALIFATIFYIQFLLMNVLNNLRQNRTFGAFDFIVVFTVNSLFYSAGMLVLKQWNNGEYQGLFTAALGVVNLSLAWFFYTRKKLDKNFVYLLIGLTITFISLAAPVQLKGNHITLFWAAESVVLFWLFQRSRITLVKIFSLLVIILMFISLVMDWYQVYLAEKAIPILLNRGYVTSIAAAAALLVYYQMMRREADSFYIYDITNKLVRRFLLVSGITIFFLAGVLEIWNQFDHRSAEYNPYVLYLQLYTFLFANILLLIFRKVENLRLAITALCFGFYLVCLNSNYEATFAMLNEGANKTHFWAHWVGVLLLVKLIYDLISHFRIHISASKKEETTFTWFAAGAIILLMSVECYHLVLWINGATKENWDYWQNLYYKAGLSIIWGILAFGMMWLGMRNKFSTLRIISLTLITVTLAKLFLYDIRNIPPGGKIAAFILLGVLLLIISFMYQRLKKIIIDDQLEKK